MKKTLYTLLSALLLITSCQKDGNRLVEQLSGEWHYTAEENGVAEDIWIAFTEEGTFEMYQMIGTGPYWYSTGEFAIDPETDVLTGVYSDRYPWKHSYRITVSDKTLTMTAVETEGYSVTYTREAIPAAVRDRSLPLTKADMTEAPRFL